MVRCLLVLVFSLAAAAALPAPAAAQAAPRAYAPEQLWQLSPRDQERVIALEYEEQSNGRRIPDDQLRFYLDQVRQSRWTFSRIKTDIAQSLRGNAGGGRPPGNGGDGSGGSDRVACESIKQRYRECATDFRGRAYVVRKLSRGECVEGRSWGQLRGRVWVNHGCRAEFAERAGGGPDTGYSVTCSSNDERYTTCAWNTRYGPPVLVERLSRHRCDAGRDWGYRGGALWVDNGCRARFAPRR